MTLLKVVVSDGLSMLSQGRLSQPTRFRRRPAMVLLTPRQGIAMALELLHLAVGLAFFLVLALIGEILVRAR